MNAEIIIALLSLISLVVGLVAEIIRRAFAQRDQAIADLRTASFKLEEELRRDIKEKTEEAQRALNKANDTENRMVKLELASAEKDEKIAAMERQLNVVCTQLESVQKQQEATRQALDTQKAENERLRTENKNLEKTNGSLFEANKALSLENKTFREALTILGMKLGDQLDPPGAKPPPNLSIEAPEKEDKKTT